MSLTPEERQKIYEEEKFRHQVRGGTRQSSCGSTCLVIVAVFVVFGIMLALFGHTPPDIAPYAPSASAPPVVAPSGSDGTLSSPKSDSVMLFGSKADALEMISRKDALVDVTDEREMQRIGEMANRSFSPKNGTRIRILDHNDDPDLSKVEILSGQFQGRNGWIRTEFIQR